MKSGGSLSIWFFVGICLGVNGLLIFITGISPKPCILRWKKLCSIRPARPHLVGQFYLLVLGLIFTLRHSPAKERARMAGNSNGQSPGCER